MLSSATPLQGFWISFGVSALLAYPIFRTLLSLKSRQTIDPFAPEGHQKKQGTPTMGGLIILAGLVAGLIATQSDHSGLVAVIAFALIGFVDDFLVPRLIKGKRGLGWKQKIILQLGAAIGTAMLIPNYAGNWSMIGLAAFMILSFSNAYNFADGLDGLAGGLLLLLAAGSWFLNPHASAWFCLLGAVIPFLALNAPPAKVFMGDVGSLPIGALIGLLSLRHFVDDPRPFDFSFAGPVFGFIVLMNFVLVLELVLVPIQVGFYKLTKKRIFPATPIHHAFEVKGWPESKVVWTFLIAQAVCAVAAWTWLYEIAPRIWRNG